MAIYLVAGKLGSGKTLACVGQIRDAIQAGRRVATNLDLDLAALVGPHNRTARVIRVPDKPTVADLEVIGMGTESRDECDNGILVLDELASWLNARTFNDRTRQPVLDWLVHSRKKGWDVFFICQHLQQIDKQVRESLVEFLVSCRRLDRLKVPFVGGLLRFLSAGFISGQLPKIHVAVVRYGVEHLAPIAERWVYRAHDLYAAYETRQVFSEHYEHGPFSYVPPGYLAGPPPASWWQRLQHWFNRCPPARKPKLAAVAALASLPPEAAIKEWYRLDAIGAFDR